MRFIKIMEFMKNIEGKYYTKKSESIEKFDKQKKSLSNFYVI